MERYAYLCLDISLAILTGISLYIRKDIASKIFKLSVLGGVAGLVSELFYFRDYWRPPTIVGTGKISPEDFIFGFTITALSLGIYPLISHRTFAKSDKPNHKNLYALLFVSGLMALLICNVYLGINSIFVSSVSFLCFSVIIVTVRRDLLKPALLSAVLLTVAVTCIYIFLFDFISPRFWDNYWLLDNTKWNMRMFGNIPLTELIWYFSWISLASVSYPFASGRIFTKTDSYAQHVQHQGLLR